MSEAKALSAVLALYTSDAVLKKYLMHHLKEGEEKEILHGKAVLHPLKNPGAILGMGKEHPGKLNGVVTAMLGAVGLRLWTLSKKKGHGMEKAAMTLLAAGGLGNLTDRVCQGYVDDYIRIPCKNKRLSQIVFNLADIFVAAGAGLMVLSALKEK